MYATSGTHPCLWRFMRASLLTYTRKNGHPLKESGTKGILVHWKSWLQLDGIALAIPDPKCVTSAITPTQPAMMEAFACAPLMPPRPDVTKTFPARLSTPRYFLPAFIMVSWVCVWWVCACCVVWCVWHSVCCVVCVVYGCYMWCVCVCVCVCVIGITIYVTYRGSVNDSLRADVTVASGGHLPIPAMYTQSVKLHPHRFAAIYTCMMVIVHLKQCELCNQSLKIRGFIVTMEGYGTAH